MAATAPAEVEEERDVAKKKRMVNTENWNIKPVIASLRGSPEFKEWVEGAAAFDRVSVAQFFERAAVNYAKQIGYKPEAPER